MKILLQKRKEQGLFRSLPYCQNRVDLTSNDYFGFSRSLEILENAHLDCRQVGATGSRLLTGNYPLYEQVEERIASFHRAEACVIYNSGYTANLGLLAALGTAETTFLYDLEAHASIYDGMRLSHAKHLPFRHNDLESLEKRLKHSSPPTFVIVESIYSISGDIAPLSEIAQLCVNYGASLIVDEAHATGIRGENGEGLVVECGLEDKVFARVHTFSKALGVHGAAVVGSQLLKDYLINFSRPLIYTTALPPPALSMIACAYAKLEREAKKHRQRLCELIRYFRASGSPIQPLYIAGVDKVKRMAQKLQEEGLDVRAIVPPTAPRGKECLRIVLHSFNTKEEIDTLWEILA
jgi:8-amino-7-oxononanoate synthase